MVRPPLCFLNPFFSEDQNLFLLYLQNVKKKNRINELKISIFSFRNAPCDSYLFQTCTMPLNRTLSTGTSPLQYAQVRLINPKIISTYVCFYFEKGRKITNHKLIFTTKGIGNNSESVYIRRVVYNAQLHGYRVRMPYLNPKQPKNNRIKILAQFPLHKGMCSQPHRNFGHSAGDQSKDLHVSTFAKKIEGNFLVE